MNNLKILQKILAIQKEIVPMEKDGRNESQGYRYLSDEKIITEVKRLMDKHQVVCQIDSKETGKQNTPKGTQILTSVEVIYTFYDCESGESLTGTMAGQGTDSNDKGVYKAITGATKYVYVKTFKIPTADDPENSRGTKEKDITDDVIVPNATQSEDGGLVTADHICLIHKWEDKPIPLKYRGKAIWDHRSQGYLKDDGTLEHSKEGDWYWCQGKGWHLSA